MGSKTPKTSRRLPHAEPLPIAELQALAEAMGCRTQREFGRALGVTGARISQIYAGLYPLRRGPLLKLVRELQIQFSHRLREMGRTPAGLAPAALGPVRFRLTEMLAARQMTQTELARRSGVSYPTINRICSNTTEGVSLNTLGRLARALGVPPGDLITRVPGDGNEGDPPGTEREPTP